MKRSNLLLFQNKWSWTINNCLASTRNTFVKPSGGELNPAFLRFENSNLYDTKSTDLRNSTIRSKGKSLCCDTKFKNTKSRHGNSMLILCCNGKPNEVFEIVKKPHKDILKGVKKSNDSIGTIINLLKNYGRGGFKSHDTKTTVKAPCVYDDASERSSHDNAQNGKSIYHALFTNNCYNKLKNLFSPFIKGTAYIFDSFNSIFEGNSLQISYRTDSRNISTQSTANEIAESKVFNKTELKNLGCKTTRFRNIYLITSDTNNQNNLNLLNTYYHKITRFNKPARCKGKVCYYLQSIRNIHSTRKKYSNGRSLKGRNYNRKKHYGLKGKKTDIKKHSRKNWNDEFSKADIKQNNSEETEMDGNYRSNDCNPKNDPLNRLCDKLATIIEYNERARNKKNSNESVTMNQDDSWGEENENNNFNEFLIETILSADENKWLSTLLKLKPSCEKISEQSANYNRNAAVPRTGENDSLQKNPSSLTEEDHMVDKEVKSFHHDPKAQNFRDDISEYLYYLKNSCENDLLDKSTPIDNKPTTDNDLIYKKPFRNSFKNIRRRNTVLQQQKVDSLCKMLIALLPQKNSDDENNNTYLNYKTGAKKDNFQCEIGNSNKNDCHSVDSQSQYNSTDSYSRNTGQTATLKSFKHDITNIDDKRSNKMAKLRTLNKIKEFKSLGAKKNAARNNSSRCKTKEHINLHSESGNNKIIEETTTSAKENYLQHSEYCNDNINIERIPKEQSTDRYNDTGRDELSTKETGEENLVKTTYSNGFDRDACRTAVNRDDNVSTFGKSVIRNREVLRPKVKNKNLWLRRDGFKSNENINATKVKRNTSFQVKAQQTTPSQVNACNLSVKVDKGVTDRNRYGTYGLGKEDTTNWEPPAQRPIKFKNVINLYDIDKNIDNDNLYNEFSELSGIKAKDKGQDKEEDNNSEPSYYRKEWVTGVEKLCNWSNESEHSERSKMITDVKQNLRIVEKNLSNNYLNNFKNDRGRLFNVASETRKQLRGKTNNKGLQVKKSIYDRNTLGNRIDGDLRTSLSTKSNDKSNKVPKNINISTDKYGSRIDRLKAFVNTRIGKWGTGAMLLQGKSRTRFVEQNSHYFMTDTLSNDPNKEGGVDSQKCTASNSTETKDDTIQLNGHGPSHDLKMNKNNPNSLEPKIESGQGVFHSSQEINKNDNGLNGDNTAHNDKYKIKNLSGKKTSSNETSLLMKSSNGSNKKDGKKHYRHLDYQMDEALYYNEPFGFNNGTISMNVKPHVNTLLLDSKTVKNRHKPISSTTSKKSIYIADQINKQPLKKTYITQHSVDNPFSKTADNVLFLRNLVQSANGGIKNYSMKSANEFGDAESKVNNKKHFNRKTNSAFDITSDESRVISRKWNNRKLNSVFTIRSNKSYTQNPTALVKDKRVGHSRSEKYVFDVPPFMPKGKLKNPDGDGVIKSTTGLPESHQLYRIYRDNQTKSNAGYLNNKPLSTHAVKATRHNEKYPQTDSKTSTRHKYDIQKAIRLHKHVVKINKSNIDSDRNKVHFGDIKNKIQKMFKPQKTLNKLTGYKNFNNIEEKRKKKKKIISSKPAKSIDRLFPRKFKPNNDYLPLKDTFAADSYLNKDMLLKYIKNRTQHYGSIKSVDRLPGKILEEKSSRFKNGVIESTDKFYPADLESDIKYYQKCSTNYLIPFVSAIDTLNKHKKMFKTASIKNHKTL